MRTITALAASTCAALAVQPIIFLLWAILPLALLGAELPLAQVGFMCLMAVVFAAPFVLFIGIPAVLLLRRFGRMRWLPLAAIGTIAGAVLVALNGPGSDPGYSSGGNWYGKPVDFIVNGEPTLYGWLQYLQSVVAFGLHGLAGASAFYLVWLRSMGPNNSSKPTPLRGAA